METIFDHDITEKEIEIVTGFPDTTREEYIKYRKTQDDCYEDLCLLYKFRKDKMKVKEYQSKIKCPKVVFRNDNLLDMLIGWEE